MSTAASRVAGRVSFVIPTKNSARTIAACVASARRQEGDVEVIVVDNSSTDATQRLARAHGADRVLVAGPERSAQRNRGFEQSTGALVVFIDSDMVLADGVAGDVRAVLRERQSGAAVLPETSFGRGYLAACRALEKRLYLGDGTAEAARAFRADVLDSLGGYDEAVFGFEDYELADRVRAAGWVISRTALGVAHDEGHVRLPALWRKKAYYGSQWRLVGRARLDRGRLRRAPLRPRLLLADAGHVPGLLLLKLIDASGLLAGHLVGRWSARRHRRTRRPAVQPGPK